MGARHLRRFPVFWMQLSLAWTGQSISQAKNLMSGTIPASSDIYFRKIHDGCKSVGALVCEDPFLAASPPAADRAASATAACVAPVKAGESSPLHSSAFCQFAWSLAVSAASSGEITEIPRSFKTYVSALLGWPLAVSARTGAMSLAFPMAGVIVSIKGSGSVQKTGSR
jgi:hypothetical protein